MIQLLLFKYKEFLKFVNFLILIDYFFYDEFIKRKREYLFQQHKEFFNFLNETIKDNLERKYFFIDFITGVIKIEEQIKEIVFYLNEKNEELKVISYKDFELYLTKKNFVFGKLLYDFFSIRDKINNIEKIEINGNSINFINSSAYLNYISNIVELLIFKSYINNAFKDSETKKIFLEDFFTKIKNELISRFYDFYKFYYSEYINILDDLEINDKSLKTLFYLSVFLNPPRIDVVNKLESRKYLKDFLCWKDILINDTKKIYENFCMLDNKIKEANIINYENLNYKYQQYVPSSNEVAILIFPIHFCEIDFLTSNSIIEVKLDKENNINEYFFQLLHYYFLFLLSLLMNEGRNLIFKKPYINNLLLINPRLSKAYIMNIEKTIDKKILFFILLKYLKFYFLKRSRLISQNREVMEKYYKKELENFFLKNYTFYKYILLI